MAQHFARVVKPPEPVTNVKLSSPNPQVDHRRQRTTEADVETVSKTTLGAAPTVSSVDKQDIELVAVCKERHRETTAGYRSEAACDLHQ